MNYLVMKKYPEDTEDKTKKGYTYYTILSERELKASVVAMV